MKSKYLNKKETESAIIQILEVLFDKSVPYSGKHRKQQWEKGWAENLESGNGTPKYFGKYPVCRLNQRFVWAPDEKYEQRMLYTIVDGLAKKYLNKSREVWEFGCGTGHNLWRIKDINPVARLVGLDWAKSSNDFVDAQGFTGHNFDFFKPTDYEMPSETGVYTVAALEQVGTDFKPFVKYLLKRKPEIVVHIEPIPELLDSRNLLDYLSIQYMRKRNYLRGYLPYLERLEKEGKIKILEARRSGIGSLMIDGYSVIVWKPI